MNRRWRDSQRILVVRLDNLGDVLLMTPAIHAIRESLPWAHIELLASPSGAQVAELDPDINGTIVYDAPWMDVLGTQPHDVLAETRMVATVADRKFDGAIIFTSYHQSPLPAAYLSYLAGIPLRHAASIDFPGSLLTTRHKHPEQLIHEVRRALNLVAAIGFSSKKEDLVLELDPDDRAEAASALVGSGVKPGHPVIVMHPGCSCQARTYPWRSYVKVADMLAERLSCSIVLTGSPEEIPLTERIAREMRHSAVSLAGVTNFRELAAIISLADVVITGNTGPMHVAAAVHTPVVALFALTNPPQQWGPWHVRHRLLYHVVPCAICYNLTCPVGHECLASVPPEQVFNAVRELVPGHAGGGDEHRIGASECG